MNTKDIKQVEKAMEFLDSFDLYGDGSAVTAFVIMAIVPTANHNTPRPRVTVPSGTQAFNNLKTAFTNHLNNQKTVADAKLAEFSITRT